MKEKKNNCDVGIVVGRFQVHELHAMHIDLIQSVCDRHPRVIVILGNSSLRNTFNNPLPYQARRAMIAEKFPVVEIHYINDVPSDELWSKNIDKLISEQLTPHQTVTLYGSRSSFIQSYKGKFPTCELESESFISGTEIRRQVSNNYKPDVGYRAGMIAATASRYPICYQTVDIAILKKENGAIEVLLGRKPNDTKFRFIGGFSDSRSESLEADAVRECQEETGLEVGNLRYIKSVKIDDWRYRGEIDKIKTAFFFADYVFGRPEADDDIAEVKWFNVDSTVDLVPEHKVLWEIMLTNLK